MVMKVRATLWVNRGLRIAAAVAGAGVVVVAGGGGGRGGGIDVGRMKRPTMHARAAAGYRVGLPGV